MHISAIKYHCTNSSVRRLPGVSFDCITVSRTFSRGLLWFQCSCRSIYVSHSLNGSCLLVVYKFHFYGTCKALHLTNKVLAWQAQIMCSVVVLEIIRTLLRAVRINMNKKLHSSFVSRSKYLKFEQPEQQLLEPEEQLQSFHL